MGEIKINVEVHEVKVCKPLKTISVFVDGTFMKPHWVKFKCDEVCEYIVVNGRMAVEGSDGCVSFPVEEFEKWFVRLEDEA